MQWVGCPKDLHKNPSNLAPRQGGHERFDKRNGNGLCPRRKERHGNHQHLASFGESAALTAVDKMLIRCKSIESAATERTTTLDPSARNDLRKPVSSP